MELPLGKKTKVSRTTTVTTLEEVSRLMSQLRGTLDAHDSSRKETQSKLDSICDTLIEQVNEMRNAVNDDLKKKYTEEDDRVQKIVFGLSELSALKDRTTDQEEQLEALVRAAKAELLVKQLYDIKRSSG